MFLLIFVLRLLVARFSTSWEHSEAVDARAAGSEFVVVVPRRPEQRRCLRRAIAGTDSLVPLS
jgi:hypothetical protein